MCFSNFLDLLVALGIAFLVAQQWFQQTKYFLRKWKSREWATIPGIVQKGEILRGGPTLHSGIRFRSMLGYAYKVDGVRSAGFFVLLAGSQDTAEHFQREFDGTMVMVLYDPKHPERSLLQERELKGRQILQNPIWLD
jgi:hypothetical protein